MNIAICDDDIRMAGQMEHLVDVVFGGKKMNYHCVTFLSADELLKHIGDGTTDFQIYLLDIEMEGTDGLEEAERIRQRDDDAIIIFVTSHAELMPKAFHVMAFQYLVKPIDEEEAADVLLSAVNRLQRRKNIYQYTANKQSHTLKISQIEYIESIGRRIRIHTVDGQEREYYGTLKSAAEKTEGILFARPHNSYIVNLEHLSQLGSHLIRMKNGCEILISNKYHSSFHTAYREFILQHSRSSWKI